MIIGYCQTKHPTKKNYASLFYFTWGKVHLFQSGCVQNQLTLESQDRYRFLAYLCVWVFWGFSRAKTVFTYCFLPYNQYHSRQNLHWLTTCSYLLFSSDYQKKTLLFNQKKRTYNKWFSFFTSKWYAFLLWISIIWRY